jgi:hypothetical protein
MLPEWRSGPLKKPKSARGKIIELPRKRLQMPGTIESHTSPRTPDSRSSEIRAYMARLLAGQHFATAYPKLPATQTILAFDAVCRNDKAGALDRIKKMETEKAPHYQLAIVYAQLHDKDEAIVELSKAADAHEGQILYIKYDPFFDEVRSDPRYVALEKRVGLI